MWRMLFCAYLLAVCLRASVKARAYCGGELVQNRGIIQTPGFPREFPVPIRCHWIINASHYNPDNVTIIVYLTQLYVTTGLTFTEYADVSFDMGSRLIHGVTEKNVTVSSWVLTPMQYLKIDFVLDRLEGNHLRVLEDLIDVYGFNLTYEIRGKDEPERPDACTTTTCSFAGNCLANNDFSQYGCSCFKGFSGRNCGQGPLCQSERPLCQNGGVCRVLGSGGHVCLCPAGVTGLRCEIPPPDPEDLECGDGGCVSQCPFVPGRDAVCNCARGPRIPTDRARYEGTFRLANMTALRDAIPSTTSVEAVIQKQIGRTLRSSNLSRMEELRILNITPGAEVTFHFFGGKKDGVKVREALNKVVERGRLGNISLLTTHSAFKQEPTLLLQTVRVNQARVVKENDEFILSCVAQGSSYMTFQWYKDGVFVNETKALRSVWTDLLPLNARDQYTAVLGVGRASRLDEGVYTCQVIDWGVQQCKSIRLEIWTQPSVAVSPMSVTLEKGSNVHIKCMSSKDGRHEKLGYNWTKNKALFKMTPGVEVWEDLSPSGSILKIYNAQKSAVYTCLVHGSLATRSVDVRVEVVNSSVVALCPADYHMGLRWPATAPALEAVEQCPPGYGGYARRRCTLQDTHLASWHLADFSACKATTLQDILNNFVSLTLGYQITSGPETLSACLRYLSTPRRLFPGEGESALSLVKEVQAYMNRSRSRDEFLNSTRTFYQIINVLLEHEASVMNQAKIVEMQEVVRTEAAVWGSLLSNPNSDHLDLSSMVVDVSSLESELNYNLRFPMNTISYPSWFKETIEVHIDVTNDDQFGNKTFTIAVVTYRNLSRFLPVRYVGKLLDGDEFEYEINSRLVSLDLTRDATRIRPNKFYVDVEFQPRVANFSALSWNVTCGFTSVATFLHSWEFDSCRLRPITSRNVTICRCFRPGTYALLLKSKTNPLLFLEPYQYNMVVMIGCACCLVQTLLTMFLLFPYWWSHRSCLIFLKMQSSGATAGAMAAFIYAIGESVPQTAFPYLTTSLEACLLIGMSSHLSTLLIVYTEVVQIPRVKNLKQTVICLITIVPVLTLLCNYLAHDSTGWQLNSWWLIWDTMIFYIFATAALVMLVLFMFLFNGVMRKLKLLSGKHADVNKAIDRRIGLLRRTGSIFISLVVMETSSIIYINVPDTASYFLFSTSSALLGFVIFVCYILKSESPLHFQVLKKLKLDKTLEADFSSDSDDNPLRFFTKQDGETESESAPPMRSDTSLSSVRCREQRASPVGQSTLVGDVVEAANRRYLHHSGGDSTVETYVQNADGSAEECAPGNAEEYKISPKNYEPMRCDPQMFSEYVEQEIGVTQSQGSEDQWQFVRGYYQNGGATGVGPLSVVKPEPGRCYIQEGSPAMHNAQEVITTRVCVELGVITSRPHCDCNGDNANSDPPSIVLCSVDVEPFHRTVFEMNDANAAVDGSTRSSSSGVSSSEPQDEVIIMNEESGEEATTVLGDSVFETPPTVLVTETTDDENTDGMLDRISHDLDYLLNRKPAKADNSLAAPAFARKTSKPPSSSVRCQIQEEDEDEGMGLSESFTSNSSL